MAAAKVVEVPLHEITVDFFVRRSLSEDHILQLAAIVEAGENLTPIILNDKYQVIDGRHRFKAYELANKTTIPCEIHKDLMRGEQILEALVSNMGGSMPPTQSDIRLAIQNMMAAGLKHNKILEGVPLPRATCRRYIADAMSKANKDKIRNAIEAVTDAEMSVADAAIKHGVSIEDLRTEIRGKKKKVKEDAFGMPKIKASITTRYRSSSQYNTALFRKLMDSYMDGECSFTQVMDTLDLTEKAITNQAKSCAEWRQRAAALKRTRENAA